MSGSIELTINTGADWYAELEWTDNFGSPIPFANPAMDIRQDYSPSGIIIARLDSTGNLDGTLTTTSPGVLLMHLSSQFTTSLQSGRGFWDLYVDVYGNKVRLAFGTVSITPHVTAL